MTSQDVLQKKVTRIEATVTPSAHTVSQYRQKRVAAYCRVSTNTEEQLNSYENQKTIYENRIREEPDWRLVGIYADKGITGTSVKNRDAFNRMIRHCKQGKIDMIITKSISRFARNTLDCLKYVRMLKDIGVDVFFEEQGIHSTHPGAEFYITIYGCVAQSESENISANVIIGKNQSAKDGNVPFQCKRFLGYRRGADDKPEIDPEQAVIVQRIYDRFLRGDSLKTISDALNADGIPTPSGKGTWTTSTVHSILTNEKYKGDAIINKTIVVDCISKKKKINEGERPMYYVQNNHPAIIDKATFARVQEEVARRCSKKKIKMVGTKTELGKYSSKYALSELLICGECHTPYRRCTWTSHGRKRIVWRCINRLDFGKKYCHESPTIEESVLQRAIMEAIQKKAQENTEVIPQLKAHIAMGIKAANSENRVLDINARLAVIHAEFNGMLNAISEDNLAAFDEARMQELAAEKIALEAELKEYESQQEKAEVIDSRLDDIYTILEGIKNRPMEWNEVEIRQLLECVLVESKNTIRIIFKGGMEIVAPLD